MNAGGDNELRLSEKNDSLVHQGFSSVGPPTSSQLTAPVPSISFECAAQFRLVSY